MTGGVTGVGAGATGVGVEAGLGVGLVGVVLAGTGVGVTVDVSVGVNSFIDSSLGITFPSVASGVACPELLEGGVAVTGCVASVETWVSAEGELVSHQPAVMTNSPPIIPIIALFMDDFI